MKAPKFLTVTICFLLFGVGYSQDRPNILWIVAEDISPFFGCYGDVDASTPNIDSFAERSHLFTNAFSTAPICAPSRSCLSTGMYATTLGTQHLRSKVVIPLSIKPLPTIFRENGYWTALRGKTDYNFDAEGLFDYWEEDTAPWRQCPKDKPFFAFMNLGSTHEGSGNIPSRAAPALARLPKERFHNPDTILLPPYFPDTPEMSRIWARYYDLISVFDLDVQSVLDDLEADGKSDDTIVFLMADHGLGLPRYKRWLYNTGLHVPLIVHIPDRFRAFSPKGESSSREERFVSYVDLPPSVLTLAGIEVPDRFQGKSLFSKDANAIAQSEYVFGARDRADDMYDLSRSIFDGRYIYIRHYMPHLSPIQEGIMFSPTKKESLIELHRVNNEGADSATSALLWSARPYEELYDLSTDPRELKNIASDLEFENQKNRLSLKLREWILETRDSGFLPEPEMHRRAGAYNLTPYEMMQDTSLYPLGEILEIAEKASRGEILDGHVFNHKDPAIRYWGLMGNIISSRRDSRIEQQYIRSIADPNPMVRSTAAEGLGRIGREDAAIPVFRELLRENEPNLALFVARSLAISLDDSSLLEVEIRAAREKHLSEPGSPRPWKDFFYSAFTCWALEWALIKSGLNEYDDFDN